MRTTRKLMTEWLYHPQAEDWITLQVEQFIAAMPPARALQAELASSNTRLVDWLDHLVLADSDQASSQLVDLGFEPEQVSAEARDTVYHHPGALCSRVVLRAETGAEPGSVVAVAIHVEDINEFLETHQVTADVTGSPFSPYRWARVWQQDEHEFLAVERRGHQGFIALDMPPDYILRYLHAFDQWVARPRQFDDMRSGMAQTLDQTRMLVSEMGANMAAWVALAAECTYWRRRSRTKQQRARKDKLGLGWTNQNHYTFRSTRETFGALVQILETLGFRSHERFHAEAEVGWGARVMEQPACRMAVFVDLDLQEQGENKLWCSLHGESTLIAGLYHFIGRFDLPETIRQVEWDVRIRNPFANLSQVFPQAERLSVHPGSGRAN